MELSDNAMKKYADKTALISEGVSNGMTYRELHRSSGKIYAWLKSHGIGKEDFVFICLPRGIRIVVAMFGVLKAGAAFVIVESTYAPERIEFIKKDCNCCLVLDENIFTEMMECDPLEGFEKTDPHDAAYAVYTSGTTGNPKGVIHEYGNLIKCYESENYEGKPYYSENSHLAMNAPSNFIAFVINLLNAMIDGVTVHIVPYSIVKNPAKFRDFMTDRKITHIFMTASMARTYRNTSPYLKCVFISSEPANGVYFEGPAIYNIYSMSEIGFEATSFRLDHSYTEASIGKPKSDLNLYILDENSNPVLDGEPGELCVEVPYVRGYINLPDKTKETFRNGILHTGDIARRNPDGNIVLMGRNDEMVKINGNRIEPAEIEEAIKKVLLLENAVAKGFSDDKRAYVCLYYLKSDQAAQYVRDNLENMPQLNEALLKRIPYYMLPTYYIELDEFPKNPNGKISRKLLPEPDADVFRNGYRAPVNGLEAKICSAFGRVLGIETVGVDDDFYMLGGDSISSMSMVAECGIRYFEAGDLFRYRTPSKIAAALSERIVNEADPETEEIEARKSVWKLNMDQTFVVDFQFMEPKSTMWNLAQLYKMKPGIDPERLALAVTKAMKNHPAFSTELNFNEDGEIVFRYNPDIFCPPEVIEISEDDLLAHPDDLRKPFEKIIGAPLYRCKIYKTQKNIYLFMDIWHIITDGTSLSIFRDEIVKLYDNPESPLGVDYFYLTLKKQQLLEGSEKWKEAADYYSQFKTADYQRIIDKDSACSELTMGEYKDTLNLNERSLAKSLVVNKIGRNAFYILCMMLATSSLSGRPKQTLNFTISARDSAEKASVFGLLYKTVPIFMDLTKTETLGEICETMQKRIQEANVYSYYPATYLIFEEGEAITNLLYQKGIYDIGRFGKIVEASVDIGINEASYNFLEIEIVEDFKVQPCIITYSADMFRPETIKKLFYTFKSVAEILVMYGNKPETLVKDILEKICTCNVMTKN